MTEFVPVTPLGWRIFLDSNFVFSASAPVFLRILFELDWFGGKLGDFKIVTRHSQIVHASEREKRTNKSFVVQITAIFQFKFCHFRIRKSNDPVIRTECKFIPTSQTERMNHKVIFESVKNMSFQSRRKWIPCPFPSCGTPAQKNAILILEIESEVFLDSPPNWISQNCRAFWGSTQPSESV